MEEKKVTKISLSTFFLILALIVIIVIVFFIFKLYNENIELSEKSAKQDEKISSLQNNVNELASELNKTSNLVSTENITTNNITNNTSTNTTTPEEKNQNNSNDLSAYLGLWENSNTFLYIYSINNNEVLFDYADIPNKGTAILNGNTASFVIDNGNNSLHGQMTFENNNIIFTITESTFENLHTGTTIFSNYMGLQN